MGVSEVLQCLVRFIVHTPRSSVLFQLWLFSYSFSYSYNLSVTVIDFSVSVSNSVSYFMVILAKNVHKWK